jgi:hypothetical protein
LFLKKNVLGILIFCFDLCTCVSDHTTLCLVEIDHAARGGVRAKEAAQTPSREVSAASLSLSAAASEDLPCLANARAGTVSRRARTWAHAYASGLQARLLSTPGI